MEPIHPFRNSSDNPLMANTRRIGEIEVSMADRKPCPVCGHPTGDCTGPKDETPNINLPKRVVGIDPMVLCEVDVMEDRQITPYTKARVLIHRKGDYISLTKARELGLLK